MLPLRNNPYLKTIVEAIQVACIGWVLLHLLMLFMYGTVVIAERSVPVLIIETTVVSVGFSVGCVRLCQVIKMK